jgi:DNA (cytosine-5)-methyltransferase 1
LTVGDCCAGIGGFSLGFERAGFDVAWQIEIDPFAQAVLTKHWPRVTRHDDIRTASAEALGYVDVLCGGIPCQPFSQASRGRRRGTSDDRWLWSDMRRLVAALRPAWVVVENVPQFDDGVALDTVVSDLEALAYDVAPPLEVPACAVGSDHWRARLWICGYTDRHGEPGMPVDAEASRLSRTRDDASRVGAAHGLSGGLHGHRMRALGNAIHPAIAERFADAIIAATAAKERAA